MKEKKPFYQSKTFWGLVTVVGAYLLPMAGINVDLTTLEDGATAAELVQVLGAGLAAWGLRTAKKPVALTGKN